MSITDFMAPATASQMLVNSTRTTPYDSASRVTAFNNLGNYDTAAITPYGNPLNPFLEQFKTTSEQPLAIPTVSTKGPAGPTTPTEEKTGNWLTNTFMKDGALNMGNIGTLVEGIGTLGALYMGAQANNLAKDQFAFQKDSFNKNYTNQLQSYNTALADRANARAARTGAGSSYADEYIAKHRLGE